MNKINEKRKINPKFKEERLQDLISTEIFLLENSGAGGAKKILDLGTGDGRAGFMVTDILAGQPEELFLTDYNPEILAQAQSNIFREEESYIKTEVQDVTKLTYPSEYFDLVLALGDTFSLVHHQNYGGGAYENNKAGFDLAIRESLRVLKEEGILIYSMNPSFLDWRYLDKKLTYLEENYNLIILEARIAYVGFLTTDVLDDKRIVFACKKQTKEKQ